MVGVTCGDNKGRRFIPDIATMDQSVDSEAWDSMAVMAAADDSDPDQEMTGDLLRLQLSQNG